MKTAYPSQLGTATITIYSNIPFDNTYKNHTIISDEFTYNGNDIFLDYVGIEGQPCEQFINRKVYGTTGHPFVYPRWTLTDDFNFDYVNGLVAKITLNLTPEQTNCNYMKVVRGNDIYYYFITGITQDNFETYTLSLELDVLMTYQDEFLQGIDGKPVFTTRKHCHRYTNDGLYPHCADFKTGDSAFAGVKPSVVSDVTQLELSGELNKLKDVKWLYICVDTDFIFEPSDPPTDANKKFITYIQYKFKDVSHPLCMICLPINVDSFKFTFPTITGAGGTQTSSIEYTKDKIYNMINSLVNNGVVHGCKISSYPPFKATGSTSITKSGNNYIVYDQHISCSNSDIPSVIEWDNNKTRLFLDYYNEPVADNVDRPRFMVITNDYGTSFSLTSVSLDVANASKPTIDYTRYLDPKLLFSPFKKYVLSATYSQGNEFYPELIYSDGVYKNTYFTFSTNYNVFIGDYSIFTYQNTIYDANAVAFYSNYEINNIGVSSSVNYVIPTGTNALDVFNSTQANSFYQSKVASGITSGLTMAGGIASVVIGSGLTFTSGAHAGSLTPAGMGMISSGMSAIAGGVASGVNAIKSTTAKIEDLKNTPDAINVQGGSFVGDYSRGSVMPFVVTYDCTELVKQNADDYFYQYGYEVSRDCFFNTELKYDNDVSGIVDNNLFGRTIFNYIQINEDITNKIDANIPLIIKQKLSSIFNQGITIWNFFGFGGIWDRYPPEESYYVELWFMKNEYDNTEYEGDRFN